MKKLSFAFLLISVLFTSCKKDIEDCMDVEALNFNPEATVDNGSCEYLRDKIIGDWDLTTMEFDNIDVVLIGLYSSVNTSFNSSGRNEWNLVDDFGTDRKISTNWEVEEEDLKLEVDLDSFNFCSNHHYTFDLTFDGDNILKLDGVCSSGAVLNFDLRRR